MGLWERFRRCLPDRARQSDERLDEVLAAFRDPDANTLELGRRLIAAIRPTGRRDDGAAGRYERMLSQLEADAGLRAAFRNHIVHFIATRRLVTFFTDSGILPGTGFFLRVVAHPGRPPVAVRARRAAAERLHARRV